MNALTKKQEVGTDILTHLEYLKASIKEVISPNTQPEQTHADMFSPLWDLTSTALVYADYLIDYAALTDTDRATINTIARVLRAIEGSSYALIDNARHPYELLDKYKKEGGMQ